MSSGRSKKSIKFAEKEEDVATVVAEVPSCFEFNEEEKKAQWYSRSDYHFSRSTARVIAKESERYGHSKHLDNVYFPSFQQEVQDQVNIWVLHGHSRRGLERWASSAHGQARKEDQYMYIQGVLRAQSEMKLKDCFNEERLREVGHILSRKSRLFAQMLGEADREAAKWEFAAIDNRLREANAMSSMLSPKTRVRVKNLGLGGPVGPIRRVSDAGPVSRIAVRQNTAIRPPRRTSDIVQPVSASTSRRPAPRIQLSDTSSSASSTTPVKPPQQQQKITIRTRPGRVPRVA